MNEQINELSKQAVNSVSAHFRGTDWQREYEKKFAELMAKKFDDILLLQQLDCIGNKDKKSAELIEKIRANTKTYFGVEE